MNHFSKYYPKNQVPEEFESRYAHVKNDNRRKLLGMTAALDDAFANVTLALSAAGLLNNSIIVFTSDVRSAFDSILVVLFNDY